jgi:hypothetical protein
VRYGLFCTRIARNTWLQGQTALRDALFADQDRGTYLEMEKIPLAFAPVIVINLLPAVAALVLWGTE